MNTNKKPRTVTNRADAMKIVMWATVNKSLIDNKTPDELANLIRKNFNGMVVTDGVIDEVVEAVGITVNKPTRAAKRKNGAPAFRSDRLRFLCYYNQKLTEAFGRLAASIGISAEDYAKLGAPSETDIALLASLKSGKQLTNEEIAASVGANPEK